ncbi:hypothetical protein Mpet_2311 [Methanolacinia petrolearia DSM 11571]|uniref:Uncharacterized protein n=1 Tax=Methanolacinia petrolearia (strain DSM 11571 / OCM 486 / SEBR 4847) TaxID=679926 RepID=E1RD75_METP4|nr:hypothetical protein Mpet_2311 [Methanolacinia petrolearia DSM 11571]
MIEYSLKKIISLSGIFLISLVAQIINILLILAGLWMASQGIGIINEILGLVFFGIGFYTFLWWIFVENWQIYRIFKPKLTDGF